MSVKGIFVVMTFSVMAWKSLGLKWTTEALHTNCCEGENKILMWSCSLEKNETVQDYRWFFQSTQIAYVSESGKFVVRDLYKGRLEQIGEMVILLKNVSSVDTGNYSLYLNLGPEPPANMQTIFLTVFESPTYQCKPSITKYPENVLFCSTNSCGGTQLSTEWRISGKYDFVSNASYLKINSSWNAEHVSCCLHRQYMQCQNGNLLDFCAWTIIFFAEDKHVPDSKNTENSMNLTPAVIVLATTTFLSIVTVIICFRNKIRRLCAVRHMDEFWQLVCIKECEDRPKMEIAVQRVDEVLEQGREARSMMGVAVQRVDDVLEQGREALSMMGVAVQRVDDVLEQGREALSMMGGAMQDKDANKEPEPIMESEARPLMGVQLVDNVLEVGRGVLSMMGVQRVDEVLKQGREARSMMGVAVQRVDDGLEVGRDVLSMMGVQCVDEVLKQGREARSMMGVAVQHVDKVLEQGCEARFMMGVAVQHVDKVLEQGCEARFMMGVAVQHVDKVLEQGCEARFMMGGKSSDSETKMSHAPL